MFKNMNETNFDNYTTENHEYTFPDASNIGLVDNQTVKNGQY
jgi:hypothetical protein